MSRCTLLMKLIKQARELTLCVDGCSKRALTASFTGMFACFYNPPGGQVSHALLNLLRMEHPHTGEAIAWHDKTLEEWSIGGEKVLPVVTDNGKKGITATSSSHSA